MSNSNSQNISMQGKGNFSLSNIAKDKPRAISPSSAGGTPPIFSASNIANIGPDNLPPGGPILPGNNTGIIVER